MLGAPAPVWPRRRSASACGCSPGTSTGGRPPGQPPARPVRGGPGRPGGLPLDSRPDLRLPPGVLRGRPRLRHARRAGRGVRVRPARPAIQHETDHPTAILFVDRLDTDARKAAMRAIREVGVVRPGTADREGVPARHRRPGVLRCGRLRRHPEVAPALSTTRSPTVRHELGASSPARRACFADAKPPARRSVLRSSASPSSSPEHPRDPAFQGPAVGPAAALLPGGGVRRPGPAGRRSTSRRSAGSTCTSRPVPPGAVPRRCSGRCGPATRSPAPRRSASSRSSTPDRPSGDDRAIRHCRDTAGDLLERLAEAVPGSCRDARRPRGRLARGATAAGRRHQLRPEDRGRRRPGRLVGTCGRHRPPGPRVHPAPGAWTTYAGEAGQAGSGAARRRPAGPGELAVGKHEVLVGTGTQAERGWGTSPVREEADARRRLGAGCPASSPGPPWETVPGAV